MKIHHFEIDNWQDFENKFLRMNRLNFLGDGAFCLVYQTSHRARHVYKVCTEFHPKDHDGYMIYLKHVILKNQNNPHVPKIYGVNTYQYTDPFSGHLKFRAIIKMEKLHDYRDLDDFSREKVLNKQYGITATPRLDDDGDDQWLYYLDNFLMNGRFEEKLNIRSPKLLKILTQVAKQHRKYKVDVDIHEGNVMWRRSGRKFELVITDPLS